MGTLKTGDTASAFAARDQVGKLLKAAHDGNLSTFKEAAKALSGGGQEEIGRALADVKDGNNRGPLCFAARGGKTEICQYLVEELHLPVDPIDKDGETPLIHAARLGFVSTAQYLLDQGADPHATAQDVGTSAIHHAAGTGSLELVKRLLDKGVSVDAASSSGTPLIWAAGHGRTEAVKLLLERGANPNATTEDDVTALLTAAAAKFTDIVELLVKNGADVTTVASGVTALHVAAEQGDEEMVKCLTGAGANSNVTDEDGSTPIQAAAIGGHRNVVELLLPLTTPLKSVPDWTVDGLMSYGEQLIAEEDAAYKRESERKPKDDIEKPVLVEVSPERKAAALEARTRGTSAFKKGNFMDAVDAYTQANELDPSSAEILSNRSLCWIRLGQAEQALVDAQAARKLNPSWSKAYYREGSALRLLQRFDEAADAFYSGVKIDPENQDLINAFKEAVEAGKKFHGTASS
ncbi:unnamed protein product [Calypogeia fissa]